MLFSNEATFCKRCGTFKLKLCCSSYNFFSDLRPHSSLGFWPWCYMIFLRFSNLSSKDFWLSSKDYLTHLGVFSFIERTTTTGELEQECNLLRDHFAELSLVPEGFFPLLHPLFPLTFDSDLMNSNISTIYLRWALTEPSPGHLHYYNELYQVTYCDLEFCSELWSWNHQA